MIGIVINIVHMFFQVLYWLSVLVFHYRYAGDDEFTTNNDDTFMKKESTSVTNSVINVDSTSSDDSSVSSDDDSTVIAVPQPEKLAIVHQVSSVEERAAAHLQNTVLAAARRSRKKRADPSSTPVDVVEIPQQEVVPENLQSVEIVQPATSAVQRAAANRLKTVLAVARKERDESSPTRVALEIPQQEIVAVPTVAITIMQPERGVADHVSERAAAFLERQQQKKMAKFG